VRGRAVAQAQVEPTALQRLALKGAKASRGLDAETRRRQAAVLKRAQAQGTHAVKTLHIFGRVHRRSHYPTTA
jgi:hypothetical protein